MNLIDVMGLGTVALRGICRLNVRFGSILLKNSVPEQGRHVTRQPEADLFDPQ